MNAYCYNTGMASLIYQLLVLLQSNLVIMNKYRILVIGCIMLPAFMMGQSGEKPFTLKGQLKHLDASYEKVYISYASQGSRLTDSAAIVKGKYLLKGKIEEPVMARLWVSRDTVIDGKTVALRREGMSTLLFLEPGTIRMNHRDSFSNVQVRGSKAQQDYAALDASLKPLNQQLEKVYADYMESAKKKDKDAMKRLDDQYSDLYAEKRRQYKNYVLDHPASPIAVYLINQYAGYDINADSVAPLLAKLPAASQSLPGAQELKRKVEIAQKTAIGKEAMDFVQNDTAGIPVRLSSFRGKYVLIDFWASWCGPCRLENPNVVKAYQKYKDKGFHIVGISLDRENDKPRWMKAIHDDGLFWTQLSDLHFWKNAVAVQYGVQAIPQNFLVDPEGKIVGKNLRGAALEKKLEEIFSHS